MFSNDLFSSLPSIYIYILVKSLHIYSLIFMEYSLSTFILITNTMFSNDLFELYHQYIFIYSSNLTYINLSSWNTLFLLVFDKTLCSQMICFHLDHQLYLYTRHNLYMYINLSSWNTPFFYLYFDIKLQRPWLRVNSMSPNSTNFAFTSHEVQRKNYY